MNYPLQDKTLNSPDCPTCGVTVSQEQLQPDRRLARCWNCGQMLRLVYERAGVAWPASRPPEESAPTQFNWGEGTKTLPEMARLRIETAPFYPYPSIQCPHCEFVNSEAGLPNGSLFCVNCGQDLKKNCIVCDTPMYLLDRFCRNCRNDQESAQYQLEAIYWQHYNEGVKLAQAKRWQEARDYLALFFNPAPPQAAQERQRQQQARQIYLRSIAPAEGERGLNLYRKSGEELIKAEARVKTRALRRKFRKWGMIGGGFLLAGIWSTIVLGNFGAIFALIPVAVVIALVLILFFGWG